MVAPKLVRRGWLRKALVTGCEDASCFDSALEEDEKKNCGKRNGLLRGGCGAFCEDCCSGEVRPEEEAIEEEDGDVEYMVKSVQEVVDILMDSL